jgi:hypothetical protein
MDGTELYSKPGNVSLWFIHAVGAGQLLKSVAETRGKILQLGGGFL